MMKRTTATAALVAVGLFTSLGFSAVAQTTRPATPSTRPATPSNRQATPSRNSQLTALDKQFVMDAAHGGMAEVQLGQLALQKSTDPNVKQFAQQMIQEHTRANQELMQLAAQKGITPPTTPGPKYEAAMMRLMQLSGKSFDQAYMMEAGLNGHLESAAVYQRQVGLGQDPDLKAFAGRILPRVQGHLEMAASMTGSRVAGRDNAMPGMQMNQGTMNRGMQMNRGTQTTPDMQMNRGMQTTPGTQMTPGTQTTPMQMNRGTQMNQ
ncbi:MAG: DUF4142 domain-containing protein [Cyanobacteriota bacterium]